MPYYDELMEWLGEVSDLESTGPGRFRLNRFEHRELAKPLSVQVTPESLAQYLERTADRAREAFPEVEPQVAALRLLIVHLQEIFSRDGESAYVAINGDGLRAPWTRQDPPYVAVGDLDPRGGPYGWSMDGPDGAYRGRLRREAEERGEGAVDV